MSRTEAERLRTRLAQQTRHLGPDDPATIRTRRQLILAKVMAALSRVDLSQLSEPEFRRLMDAILDARGGGNRSLSGSAPLSPAPRGTPGVARGVGAYER